MAQRIGCDVGGTFTDFVFVDATDRSIRTGKLLTTPNDPSEAILAGVDAHSVEQGKAISSAEEVIHGTTLGINALLERRGAKTGLLVTKGFRDVLDIRRCNRVDMYDIQGDFPEPLIPRRQRGEVHERIYSDGAILQPLDEEGARKTIKSLIDDGVESIAICTLHSYVNPRHEQRLAELVAEQAPTVAVSLSSQVAAEIKEFERSSTTAIDAYLKPKMQTYLTRLEENLRSKGFSGKMYLMLSGGSIAGVQSARRMPARLVESGPMAGAIAAKYFAERLGSRDVVSYDMGGTSAKACLIRDGEIPISREYEVDRSFRFKRGSGMPLTVPTVDLIEIGAGGGSIATIDDLGLLKVGPRSAGALPGPACYGRGGELPTVTDADLLLGYLDPDYFLGGKLRLDAGASRSAMERSIGTPLKIDALKAAWGVHKVVNESMANAIKTCVAERGGNIYTTTMVAFGGAGPVHAVQLARTLKIPRVLIPPFAGVVSALGFLLAPLAYGLVRTHKVPLERLDLEKVQSIISNMEQEAASVVAEAGVQRPIATKRFAELCFIGQGYPVMISLPSQGEELSIATLHQRFLSAYRKRYGNCSDSAPVELVSLHVVASVEAQALPPTQPPSNSTLAAAPKGRRKAFEERAGCMIDYDVYDRYALPWGSTFEGPALIQERETTTVVPSGALVKVQDDGALLITVSAESAAVGQAN